MRGCARRLNADGAAVEPVGQAASGDEAVERSGDMVGKAAEQGHVSGLSWIESIDARPIAAWAARKALHRLRAAGSNDMAEAGGAPARPLTGTVYFVCSQGDDRPKMEGEQGGERVVRRGVNWGGGRRKKKKKKDKKGEENN